MATASDGSLIFDVKVDAGNTSVELDKVRRDFYALAQEIKDQRWVIRDIERYMANLAKEAEKEEKSIYGVSAETTKAMVKASNALQIAKDELVDMQVEADKLKDTMKQAGTSAGSASTNMRNIGREAEQTNSDVKNLGSEMRNFAGETNKTIGNTSTFTRGMRDIAKAAKDAAVGLLSNSIPALKKVSGALGNVAKQAWRTISPFKILAGLTKRFGSIIGSLAGGFFNLLRRLSIFTGLSIAVQRLSGSFTTLRGRIKSLNASTSELGQAWRNFSGVVYQIILPALQLLTRGLSLLLGKITAFLAKKFDVNVKAAADALQSQSKSMGTLSKNTKKANQALLAFDELNKIDGQDKAEDGGVVSDADVENAQAVEQEMKKVEDTSKKVAENTKEGAQSLSQGGQAVQTLLVNLGDIWSEATPKLTEAATNFGTKVKEIWGNAWNDMQPSIEQLKTNIAAIWSDAGTQLAPIWEEFKTKFSEAIQNGDFVGAAIALKDAIVAAWPIVWQAFKDTVKAGWDFLTEVAPIIWDALVNTIKAGWDFIKEIAPILWNAIVETVKAGWDFVKEIAPMIWDAIKEVASTGWDWVKAAAPIVWEAIKEVAKTGWDWVKAVAPVVWDAIKEVGTTLVDWIAKIAPDIWQGLIDAGTTLTEWIIGWIPDVWVWLVDSAQTLYDSIKETIPKIWDWLVDASKKILDFLSSPELGEKFWEAIKKTVKFLWDILMNAGPLFWKGIVASVKILWNLLKGLGKLIWNILVAAIKDGWNALWKWIKEHLSLKRLFGFGSSDNDNSLATRMVNMQNRLGTHAIPALASGAVIPPNNPYLTVVGDQTSGTNIETPLQTMIDAFKQALAETGYGKAVMEVDGTTFAQLVYKYNGAETARVGVNLLSKE